jgi:membrane protease subunit HflK
MVDTKAGNNLIYLPLDKLIAQTASDGAKQQQQATPSSSTPLPGVSGADLGVQPDPSRDVRSRDPIDLRSREGR